MTTTRVKSLCLREHEVRALLRCGGVLAVRTMKPQPRAGRLGNGQIIGKVEGQIGDGDYQVWQPPSGPQRHSAIPLHKDCLYRILPECPFGEVEDRRWVQETWCPIGDMRPSGMWTNPKWIGRNAFYAADHDRPTWAGSTWRSATQMKQCDSRLTVEVSAVQCKRVQEITEDEAKAAGIEGNAEGQWKHYLKPKYGPSPIHSFETLWRSLHGPDAWASNPFVWACDLRRVEG